MTGKTLWFGPKMESKRRFNTIKYLLLAYICLVLVFEVLWTTFIVHQFHDDLNSYDWDAIWIKEFYKSTKNFFIFTAILAVLVLLLGLAATATENKQLLMVFLIVFMAEWGFESVGVYASKDRNVLIYKMIPATLRPGLIVVAFLFYLKLRSGPGPEGA